ncbi:DoxX family protein [Tardiphaga alba]|uniref:DoxX family protein n=1 Tax=Tardiphaga alba TaxID=340268 RepID=A0ABX8A7W2_9BRAD|nr:DoxX family protein [Tardiphaga alba]QUS39748.1 DoxX family protein [Tardiphaga alba]
MPAFITFGRILFAVIFIASGVSKFIDLSAAADMIANKVIPTIPADLLPYTQQLEQLAKMELKQILAIAVAALELLGGIMIALNFGARFFALVLVLFVMAATFYFHDFWNLTGAEAKGQMIHALKNLSLIGGLFIIAGIGKGPRMDGYHEA